MTIIWPGYADCQDARNRPAPRFRTARLGKGSRVAGVGVRRRTHHVDLETR